MSASRSGRGRLAVPTAAVEAPNPRTHRASSNCATRLPSRFSSPRLSAAVRLLNALGLAAVRRGPPNARSRHRPRDQLSMSRSTCAASARSCSSAASAWASHEVPPEHARGPREVRRDFGGLLRTDADDGAAFPQVSCPTPDTHGHHWTPHPAPRNEKVVGSIPRCPRHRSRDHPPSSSSVPPRRSWGHVRQGLRVQWQRKNWWTVPSGTWLKCPTAWLDKVEPSEPVPRTLNVSVPVTVDPFMLKPSQVVNLPV
jgi:hypothetical protein